MDENPTIASPEDPALVEIAEQILMRRKLLQKGKWLCDELKIALRELDGLMQSAELTFEEYQGAKPTIIIRPTRTQQGNAGKSVEAYSLKMMARSLRNPGNLILSLTLCPSCLQARKALIDALFRLYELVTNEKELALAKKRVRNQASAAIASGQGRAGADDSTRLGLAHRQPAPRAAERRDQLRQQVMKLAKVRQLWEHKPEAFHQILEQVFAEVETGALPAAAVTGKILDLVYADDSSGAAAAETSPPPPPPARPAESPPRPSKPEAEAALARRTATEPRAEPAGAPADIPERLGNWAAQGLAGNRLFKQLKRQGDLEQRIVRWQQDGQAGSADIEQAFVSHFLERVTRFTVDGQAFSFELPASIGPLDVSDFEALIEQGKEAGAYGIDPRIWGVVGTAFLFLKNAFSPLLRADDRPDANAGKTSR